ncbi:hypothetical protein F2Q68_00028154 [Brassica cretica]|uniref:Uncharacterized protein n=1 Tax=Brassica cretica TaxID=69181 RepID=A0A8S9ID54_BRACR|nr:hypothetical protein F2Q68_00028154 [Brassica cretica]
MISWFLLILQKRDLDHIYTCRFTLISTKTPWLYPVSERISLQPYISPRI